MQYQMRFQYLNPEAKLRDNRQRLADLDELLRRAMKNRIAEERHMLGIYLERYRGLSPLYKLNQGYSFVSDREGNGIISTKQVHSGDLLEISVTDGVIEAEVRSSRKAVSYTHLKSLLIKILLLILLSAVLANFADVFESGQIGDICFYIVYLLLFILLMASFSSVTRSVQQTITWMAEFMRGLAPAYFLTISIRCV